MTKEALEQVANRVIASAKVYLELQEEFPPQFLLHHHGDWQKFPMPEEAGELLNHGKAKDLVFGFFRNAVQALQCDAAIFASDMWRGEPTEEGKLYMDTPEWNRLHNHGFTELVKRGWVKRSEIIGVTAQNAEGAWLISQTYQRLGAVIQLLDCERKWFPQANFSGRQKMFGDLRQENLGSEGWVQRGPGGAV